MRILFRALGCVLFVSLMGAAVAWLWDHSDATADASAAASYGDPRTLSH